MNHSAPALLFPYPLLLRLCADSLRSIHPICASWQPASLRASPLPHTSSFLLCNRSARLTLCRAPSCGYTKRIRARYPPSSVLAAPAFLPSLSPHSLLSIEPTTSRERQTIYCPSSDFLPPATFILCALHRSIRHTPSSIPPTPPSSYPISHPSWPRALASSP